MPESSIGASAAVEKMPDGSPGSSNRRLQVAVSPSGEPVYVRVVEIRGSRPGPTLCLLSGVHGDEGLGPLALTGLLASLRPEDLSGTVRAVPVCNTPAFGVRSRVNPWDGGDLIRLWPGDPVGSITERTAAAIFEEVVRGSDALVDLHSGNPVLHEYWGIYGNSRGPGGGVDPSVEDRSRKLAAAFGLDQLLRGHPWFGTQMAAAQAGIPAFIAEIGGGSDFHRHGAHYLDVIRRGVRNVMIELGILTGDQVADTATCRVFDIAEEFISRSTGGYWLRAVQPGDRVRPGDVIGTFLDPQTGEERDRVVAQKGGIVLNPTADWPHIGLGQWLLALGDEVAVIERSGDTRVSPATD